MKMKADFSWKITMAVSFAWFISFCQNVLLNNYREPYKRSWLAGVVVFPEQVGRVWPVGNLFELAKDLESFVSVFEVLHSLRVGWQAWLTWWSNCQRIFESCR